MSILRSRNQDGTITHEDDAEPLYLLRVATTIRNLKAILDFVADGASRLVLKSILHHLDYTVAYTLPYSM